MTLTLRDYRANDRAAVLALFDANVPAHFSEDERVWLEDSLDELEGPALLASFHGAPVAFGGFEIWDYYDKALLVWGMAHPAAHGLGVGRWLLFERLARIARAEPATRWVSVDTSPAIAPFFLRQGFETASVWPHGYRAGGDMHVMRLDLAGHEAGDLDARAAAAYASASARLQQRGFAAR